MSRNLVQALPVAIQQHVLGNAAPSVTAVSMRMLFILTAKASGPHQTNARAAPVSRALLNVCPTAANKHPALNTFPYQSRAQVHPEIINTQPTIHYKES